MAVNKNKLDLKLQIRVSSGTTSTGKTAYKNISYSNIRIDAKEEELLAAFNALSSMQSLPVDGCRVVETYDLTATA